MNNKRIFIDLDSKKYNFVLKRKKVNKIKVILPLFSYISCELNTDGSQFHLKIFDRVACYYLGNKKDIFYRNSLNLLSKTVKIVVPDNIVINLDACNEEGNIYLKNINFDKLNFKFIAGNINMNECSGNVVTSSGVATNVSVLNTTSNNISIKTTVGSINYANNNVITSKLQTEIGTCHIKLKEEDICKTNLIARTKELPSIVLTGTGNKLLTVDTPYGKFTSNIL